LELCHQPDDHEEFRLISWFLPEVLEAAVDATAAEVVVVDCVAPSQQPAAVAL
jgi:hypothetical protein